MKCLVLLDEPGVGKSTAIEQDNIAVRAQFPADSFLSLDQGEYGDETRLISDLFDSQTFERWAGSEATLHVFLDGLDECRVLIPNVSRLIHWRLSRHSETLDRLRLRIACRTADWPASLNANLAELFGEDDFSIQELVPLRRTDVLLAAREVGLDEEAFVFLMNLFARAASFPQSQVELYRQGCRLLCEETNQDRRDAGLTGGLSAEEKLRVVERIGAATVFCNRPNVITGVDVGECAADDLQIVNLAGGTETVGENDISVGESEIHEAIGTGVFSGRGAERLGFAHRTYAEFLSASYIIHREMRLSEQLKIIRHAEDASGRIVPQLRELAAWMASMNDAVFESIAISDPQVWYEAM